MKCHQRLNIDTNKGQELVEYIISVLEWILTYQHMIDANTNEIRQQNLKNFDTSIQIIGWC